MDQPGLRELRQLLLDQLVQLALLGRIQLLLVPLAQLDLLDLLAQLALHLQLRVQQVQLAQKERLQTFSCIRRIQLRRAVIPETAICFGTMRYKSARPASTLAIYPAMAVMLTSFWL
jgi:hypothetical protein